MNPGPEMDAIVAENVMGWRWTHASEGGGPTWHGSPPEPNDLDDISKDHSSVPPYSTNIAAAWTILEKAPLGELRRLGDRWGACLYGGGGGYILGATVPEAICRAALKAVGVEV